MAGIKGRFKIRGEDGRIRTVGNCQSAGQAIRKFILDHNAPDGYHGTVWRQGYEGDKKNFRVTAAKIAAAEDDHRQKKRYLND